ncbi:Hypothetical predicted protein [Cloeon dipterum]|uniref:HMG box domain-containing protein n=1 Tax=Cloeon dipterum TaxID=197152 RepID=A0A8S1E3D8_9INSE|nr:Hypothetical predicted protein [Cloeon dipterum]
MTDAVKFLDKNTARLITSNQVIQGPYNIVKELVENALDAGATAIDIRLENYGLDKVTVKDNAKGISLSDVSVMCKPGYSSKIKEFSDLESLRTYGFRGEALASICCISDVSITTKTEEDPVATTYKFNSDGEIVDKSPSHLNQGTLICVQNIYHHQPARRRILLSAKATANTQGFSKTGTISKIKSYLGALGVAWPFVRIFFVHGGSLVWKKQSVPIAAGEPIKTALGEVLGHNLVSNYKVIKSELDEWGSITAVLPTKVGVVNETCQSTKSALILIINKRVVRHKKIEDVLMERFRFRFPSIGKNRYPACVLDLKVNQEDLDVNLEPDKSKFMMRSAKEDQLLEAIQTMIDKFYDEEVPNEVNEVVEPPANKRQKISDQETAISSVSDSQEEPAEKSSPAATFKLEFFVPETPEVPETPVQPSPFTLSEPSSEDEMEDTLKDNSLLSTPKLPEDIEDFVFSEEDEAALLELEKLVNQSDSPVTEEPKEAEAPMEVNQADWSRGHVPGSSGNFIEGCQLLVQPKAQQPKIPKAKVQNDRRLSLSASPCTQMGQNNLRAFNMFCKETRPKLLKDRPNMGLCEVAPLLARLWKDLPDEEKEKFGQMAQEYKLSKLNNSSVSNVYSPVPVSKKQIKKKEPEKSAEASLCLSMLKTLADKKTPAVAAPQIEIITKVQEENSQKSPIKKKKITKVVEVPITLDAIMKKKFARLESKVPDTQILGEWNGNWLVRQGSEISTYNPWLIKEILETILNPQEINAVENKNDFKRLLENFTTHCSLEEKCPHGKPCRATIYSGPLLSQTIKTQSQ